MNTQFQFPDEIKQNKGVKPPEDEVQVEIIDDTPPEDRNRAPMPEKLVKEIEDDDLEEYSEKVKKRLSQLKKVFHDERRAKEAAAREKEEALRFAQVQFEENKQLKQRLGAGEKVFITEVTKAATTEITSAKERLKQAYEGGDAEKITAAQEALTNAQLKLNDYSKFQPSALQQEEPRVQPQQQPSAPAPAQVDRKALAWREKNTWFGQDEEMTALALGLHEKLVRSRVDPSSDDYYEQVDKTMRKRFPDYFEEEEPPTPPETKPEPRKNTTIVAPATRSSAPRQIRLTASAAALAQRLGITPEAYAREQMKLEKNNG